MTQILSETPLPAEYIEIVNATHSTGLQFLKQMDDILDLAQLESGEFCLAQQSFILREGLEQALQQNSCKAKAKNLNFNLFFDERTPEAVQGDVRRVQQVFEHLLDNAIKFTEKGEITVSISSQLNHAQHLTLDCMVKDTGCGIPSTQIGSLFQAFSKTHVVQGGTGVGLALCQRLCQAMGGTLWVESVEGEGSTFYFTLKLQRGYIENISQAIIEPPIVLNKPNLNAVQVLVVEDNTMSQKVATLILKRMGCHADVVNNGLEAIRALETKRYDVLLMDVRMPELDGLETTRRILERWKAPNTPYIIAMTANVQPEARSQCLAMGMNDYLSKPVHVDELEAAFMRWRVRVGNR
jgi:CheY-like chemotaxis protein